MKLKSNAVGVPLLLFFLVAVLVIALYSMRSFSGRATEHFKDDDKSWEAMLFTAPWCGFCKSLKDTESYANMKKNLKVTELNIDEPVNNKLMKELSVTGVPTLLVAKKRDNFSYEYVQFTGDIKDTKATTAFVNKHVNLGK